MNVREWALVLFTILAQMAVGSFLVLGCVHFFAARKAGLKEADRMSDRTLFAIGAVLILAMLASLFHLGNPANAYRAVSNLGMSWLSREILSLVLCLVLGGVFLIMQWKKISTFSVRNVIAWAAALCGVFLVYSMSNLYMIETQPAWNSFTTPISFAVTTLLLGLLAVGASLVANYAYNLKKAEDCAEAQCDLLRSNIRWIAIAAIVLLGIEFVIIPLYMGGLAGKGGVAINSLNMLVGELSSLLVLRLVLAFVGAGIFAVFLYQYATSPGQEKVMGNLVYGAFALVLVAEIIGRFLFYATQGQIGI